MMPFVGNEHRAVEGQQVLVSRASGWSSSSAPTRSHSIALVYSLTSGRRERPLLAELRYESVEN
jgi:hypothetical protein